MAKDVTEMSIEELRSEVTKLRKNEETRRELDSSDPEMIEREKQRLEIIIAQNKALGSAGLVHQGWEGHFLPLSY